MDAIITEMAGAVMKDLMSIVEGIILYIMLIGMGLWLLRFLLEIICIAVTGAPMNVGEREQPSLQPVLEEDPLLLVLHTYPELKDDLRFMWMLEDVTAAELMLADQHVMGTVPLREVKRP